MGVPIIRTYFGVHTGVLLFREATNQYFGGLYWGALALAASVSHAPISWSRPNVCISTNSF